MALRTKTIEYGIEDQDSIVGDGRYIPKVYLWDNLTAAFTDMSRVAASAEASDITYGLAASDIVYLGLANEKFTHARFQMGTAGVGGAFVWEYWNGASWATLTTTADALPASGHTLWNTPTDWAKTTVNSFNGYWVRWRCTTAPSTQPIGTYVAVGLPRVQVWTTATFTDFSTAAWSAAAADITFGTTVNREYYFSAGSTWEFNFLRLALGTAGIGGVLAWEYWNGASWSALTLNVNVGSANLTGGLTHEFTFTPPTDWAASTVNNIVGLWIRARVTTGYSTAPVGTQAFFGIVWSFTKTIYVPENTSRTFRSVGVQTFFKAPQGAITLTHQRASLALGGTRANIHENQSDLSNSGENVAWQVLMDATAAFAANFGSGTSQTATLYFSMPSGTASGIIFGGIPSSIKFILTYEFDDTGQTTRICTVRIPIGSPIDFATTVLTELNNPAANQVPALDTELPEDSKVFRDIFFEIQGNTHSVLSGSANGRLGLALDSETVRNFEFDESTAAAVFYKALWSRTDMATNAAHAIKTQVSNNGYPWRGLSITLVVTYEYNHTNSTRIYNSLLLPMPDLGLWLSDTAHEAVRSVWIEEPGTITMRQSAVFLTWTDNGNSTSTLTLAARAGALAQTATGYLRAAALNVSAGQMCVQHRIDGTFGLVRGRNDIILEIYDGVANFMTGTTGMMLVNYTSDKAAAGADSHNHTTHWLVAPNGGNSTAFTTSAVAPNIPETEYFVTATGFSWSHDDISAATSGTATLLAHVASGEFEDAGLKNLGENARNSDGEAGFKETYFAARDLFSRWPGDPEDRLQIENARAYKMQTTNNGQHGLWMVLTYHAQVFALTGTVSGYSGDGSGIVVEVFRDDTDAKVGYVVTEVGGGYSFPWYDDTIPLYAVARQDDTHLGRSIAALAA